MRKKTSKEACLFLKVTVQAGLGCLGAQNGDLEGSSSENYHAQGHPGCGLCPGTTLVGPDFFTLFPPLPGGVSTADP